MAKIFFPTYFLVSITCEQIKCKAISFSLLLGFIFQKLTLNIFFSPTFQMSSPPQHHEPMVAMICPEKTGEKLGKLYHNQYMSAEGKWTTDFDHKATCRQDKVEILEYCKKVYHTVG